MKKIVNILFIFLGVLAAYVGYESGNYAPFMLTFALTAFFNYEQPKSDMAFACLTPCTLGTPSTQSGTCGDKGGVRRMWWAKYSDIDWAAIKASAPSFDTATHEIKAFIMVSSAVFKPVNLDQKLGEAEAVYSDSDGFYKNVVKASFMGQTSGNRLVFYNALSCKNLVIITLGNNGNLRIYGVDYDGTVFSKTLTPFYIDTHGDYSGTLGGSSKSRDELNLVGESLFAPLFLNMLESAIPVA